MAKSPLPRPSRWRRLLLGSAAAAGHVGRFAADYGTAIVGLGAVSYGAGQVYGPAGWITFGALLLADRIVDDHRAAREQLLATGGERR